MAGVAAGDLPRDGRLLTEEQHQEPWSTGNPNKSPVVGTTKLKQEKLLLSKGGEKPIEELPVFYMEERYFHENPRVTSKNSLIVMKLNGMRMLWTQYQEELVREAPKLEVKVTLRSLSNLRDQIRRLQAEIRNEGGVAYPVPAILENITGV